MSDSREEMLTLAERIHKSRGLQLLHQPKIPGPIYALPLSGNDESLIVAALRAAPPSGGPVRLPPLTPDQQEWFEKTKRETSQYDPTTVIGGPRAAPRCDAEIVERCAKVAESFQRSHRDFSVALDIAKAIRALSGRPSSDAESNQSFVEMLWKWFEDRGADLRSERQTGLTANDFRTMLDEHEAALLPAAERQCDAVNMSGTDLLPMDEVRERDAALRTASRHNVVSEHMARLSASEAACYRWPEDTAEHKAMRAAFMDGAAHTASRCDAETTWTAVPAADRGTP